MISKFESEFETRLKSLEAKLGIIVEVKKTMDKNLIGSYRGAEIYGISLMDYLGLSLEEKRTNKHWWVIIEDNNLIFNGQIVGKLDGRNVNLWKDRIDVDKAYAARVRKMRAASQPSKATTLISERPTIEALATAGSQRLEEVVKAAEANLEEKIGTGEEKLREASERGIQLTSAIQKRRKKKSVFDKNGIDVEING